MICPDRDAIALTSMTRSEAEAVRSHAHIQARRARMAERLGRPIETPPTAGKSLSAERVDYLVREAEELYWNELAWEELTDEERVAGGHLTELVFPGLLAFVDALLSRPKGEPGVASRAYHPEVVEEVLLFLAGRHASTTADLRRGADSEKLVWARAMTSHLIDLILYRLHELGAEERDELEGRG